MGALTHSGEVLQGLPADASQINFDKTGTDLNATQTEAAIKEVNVKANTNAADITQLKSGLINKVEMKTTQDLNSANTTGVYFFAYNAQNVPSPHSGTVLTLTDASGVTGMQIARVTTENTVYVRFCDNSTWTAWKQLAFTA